MREQPPPAGPPAPNHDVDLRAVLVTGAAIAATVVLAIAVAFAVTRALDLPAGGLPIAHPAVLDGTTPASTLREDVPRLQSAPQSDLAAYRKEKAREEAPLAPPPTRPAVGLEQHPGAQVPADLSFIDSDGHATHLGETFGGPPVLLVLGYYRCTQLCGVVAQGLLEALHDSALPSQASRLVFVSIDPHETPGDAAARLKVDLDYARFLQTPGGHAALPWLRLLTGPRASIAALAHTVGVAYRDASSPPRDGAPATRGFAHPAAVIVLTPAGRVSRYFSGVRFDPVQLREAIAAAGAGAVVPSTLGVILQCLHLAGGAGSRDAAVLVVVRLGVLFMIALLLAVVLVRRGWHSRARSRDGHDRHDEGAR
jgi:protein SCO1/2